MVIISDEGHILEISTAQEDLVYNHHKNIESSRYMLDISS